MKARLHHPAIVVPNLSKAIKFYSQLLDLVTIKESKMEAPSQLFDAITGLNNAIAQFCLLKGNNFYLELFEFKGLDAEVISHNGAASNMGIRHLAFQVDEVTQAVRELITLGGTAVGSIEKVPSGGTAAYCRDPFGNIIEFTRPQENFPKI